MAVSDIVAKRSDEYLQRLTEACSIPSMASDPKGLADMAGWLHERFVELGAKVDRLTQDGAPDALLAEIGSGDRTV
ncbi:MAG TPA: hypothetical protein VE975_07725, partial [Actinomycetota bacterium]|nr:hypothetical protein [Actinomycetota bacterium]